MAEPESKVRHGKEGGGMPNTSEQKQAVVIGGGIAGLTVCYRLTAEAQKRGIPLNVKLLEASDRVGGVIRTSHQDGFIVEHGPDAFLSAKPGIKELCEELGIDSQWLGTNPKERRSFVLRKGKLCAVPEAFYMMAPAAWSPFLKTPIFSWGGKLRMALELFIPRTQADTDESVAHFVKRRLGKEAYQRIAQPMIGGIYTANAEDLSLKATVPQFLEMEQAHRSIIRALIARRKQSKQTASGTSGPRYSLFLSFQSGMQTLTDTLAERLSDDCIRLDAKVGRVENCVEDGGWRIHIDNQQVLNADLVCIALPAHQTSRLVERSAPELAKHLAAIPYASSARVNFAFRREDVGHPLNGMGFIVPAIEERSILGCTFSSVKFEERAPVDQVLLRVSIGGALQAELLQRSESELIKLALKEVHELLGVTGEPIFSVFSQHTQAMAQYHVGHLGLVSQIEAQAQKLRGFALAGNAYRGIGIPDCINSGEQAAQNLMDSLPTVC